MGKENMQNKKPMILVLAGPNGSGKSTITAFFDKVGKYTNADDIVALEVVVDRLFAAEVGRRFAVFPHNKCTCASALALRILGDDAIIACQRECLHDPLSVIALVGQHLNTAGHGCVENDLRNHFAVRTEGFPAEDGTVL